MRRSFSARTAATAVLAAMIGATTVACSNAESDGGSARQVTVVGSGEVRGAPDVLNADIGVEFTAPDVSGAISGANERARAMIDAVTADGVAREDIRTTGLSLQPEYATPGIEGGSRSVSGYLAANTVRVVVRDLGKASQILDDALRAGGDAARLNGVSYGLEDDSRLLADARSRAFDDARTRAQQYAELAGVPLGDVLDISETSSVGQPPVPSRQSADRTAAIPLEPGTETVTFQVTVKWGLG